MFIVRPVVAGAIFLLAQTPGSGATLSAVEAAKQNALVASESDDIQNDNWLLRQRAFTRMTATMTAASGENAVSADAATPASRHAIFTLLDEDVGYAKLAMQSAGAHDVEPIYYGAKRPSPCFLRCVHVDWRSGVGLYAVVAADFTAPSAEGGVRSR
jgi:hypothetical protein